MSQIIDSKMTFRGADSFEARNKAEEFVQNMRDLRKGDIIRCKGIKAVIDKVTFCERYTEYDNDLECYRLWISCEFTDTNGNYRSYKSFYDGGVMELVQTESTSIED